MSEEVKGGFVRLPLSKAAEREWCAKLLEDDYEQSGKDFEYLGCLSCAGDIRNLGASS